MRHLNEFLIVSNQNNIGEKDENIPCMTVSSSRLEEVIRDVKAQILMDDDDFMSLDDTTDEESSFDGSGSSTSDGSQMDDFSIDDNEIMPAPILLVTGGPGVGKRYVADGIKHLAKEINAGYIQTTAFTGIAAVNIKGETINSTFNVRVGEGGKKRIYIQNDKETVDQGFGANCK